jgi:two-component system phosphate regulon sensor histidine kinase PhoR
MNRLRWLSLLMAITILGITGFQAYWLKENYDREKNSLDIRTQFHFRETMLALQVAKLNLPGLSDSTGEGTVKMIVQGDGKPMSVRFRPKKEMVSTINVIRQKVQDSVRSGRKPYVISMDQTSVNMSSDSVQLDRKIVDQGPSHIFNLLYGVDSLQDSIRIREVDSLLRKSLDEEGLDVPFSIQRTESPADRSIPQMNKITIGIRNPVTYEMSLGNTFSYLVKRITLPILFSLLLLGITITSFILLYRNFVKQKRLADLKNEFISNITHELKTPIATVGVAIEALKSFNAIDDPKKTKEYLEISSNELQRLGLLVDKVLKLSMFEKKEMGIKTETLDIGQLVDEVLSSLRLQVEKYGAEVQLHKEGNLQMEGDRLHLLSVIFNLLDNALKYSSDKPDIMINMKGEGGHIELTVADRGIGIPSVYKNKIFEKFFRVPQGNTHNAKGYGLGLSYVAHVIKKHKGSVRVDDNPGGGTSFTVSLPKNQS